MAEKLGRIRLGDYWYNIDLESYRARDVSDYSPRASTPGGGIIYSEMSAYQPLSQDDWRHGFGFLWHTDSSGFYDSEGAVDTRFAGVVTPFTKTTYVSSTITTSSAGGFLASRDGTNMIIWGSTGTVGIRNITTGALSYLVLPFAPTTLSVVHGAWSNGTYDFLLINGRRPIRIASWSPAGNYTASGGGANYIDDADGSFVDDQWNGRLLEIISGTGAGQSRFIADTDGTAKRITLADNWTTNPDATSVFTIWEIYQTGINTNATDFKWMTAHDGFVFAGKEGTNQVYYASSEDLSDLHGATADDPNVILVGAKGRAVKGAISYAGDLFFARDDGLYRMDKDRTAARKVLDYSDQSSYFNFLTMTVHNGALIFPIRHQLYQWNGVRVNPITPPRLGTTHPFTTYWYYSHMVVSGNFLFVLARRSYYVSGSSRQDTDLLAFDGVGWHCLTRQVCGSTFTGSSLVPLSGMGLVVASNSNDSALWFMTYQALGSGATTGLYTIPLNADGDYPYASFTTGTTVVNAVQTSRFDAGFRRVTKSTPSILIEASNLSTTAGAERYILVYYKTDETSDAWVAWGQVDGTSNKITANGITMLMDPGSTASDTLEYKWIQLRFVLVTSITSQAPVLESSVLRVLLRPDTMYGYAFNIIAAKQFEYAGAQTSDLTAADIILNLRALRDSKAPVDYVTPFGSTFQVYVTSITELAQEDHISDMGQYPDIEHLIQVNLMDVDTYATRTGRAAGAVL